MLLINKSLNHKLTDDKTRRGISLNRQDGLCIHVSMCVWSGTGRWGRRDFREIQNIRKTWSAVAGFEDGEGHELA